VYQNRDQVIVNEWINETQPIVQKALQNPKTVLLVADEMIITSQTTTQKIWFPIGIQPVIECANKRKRRTIYGFLNIKTGE
jgi:hypothetical protein